MRILLIAALAALLFAGFAGDSHAQDQDDNQPAVLPAGRQAVLWGPITDIDPDGLTINHMGREVEVDAETLVRGGLGDLNDYYDEGMSVTVEGILTDEDKILASRITQGGNYNDVPPYIVNNPGIIGADDLD